MQVSELIELLKKFPPEMDVVYTCYSEYCTLNAEDVELKDLCETREDGWVARKRPDKPTKKYLAFPGN